IQKIDKSKISTYKNIAPVALDKLSKIDTSHEYAIPFVMGSTAIIVNTKYVKNYPEDFSIFTRVDLKGRMTLLNDMRQVMTSALLTLGYKQNSVNPVELEAASKLINSWKKNIAKFDSESFGKSFLSEEYYVVHGYTDNVSRDLTDEQRKTTKFIIPKKGGLSYVDSFVIPKTAKNVENAIKFIEYIHRPEVYAKLADKIKVPSINIPAEKLMKSAPIYKISDLKNTTIIEDIGDALPVQQKYWEKILTD
ncbi:MAG: extracellular solute-binding protein, partial [Fusobacteriaceae bacterium]